MRRTAAILAIVLIHAGLPLGMGLAADVRLDVPRVRQKKDGCGAASVAMVVHYWKNQHPALGLVVEDLEKIHDQLYSPEVQGIPLADMTRYLQERGFHAFTMRASWQDLEDHLSKGRPVIAGLRKNPKANLHYVVVVGLEGARVLVNDPARRRQSAMKRPAFEKNWNLAERWMLLAVPR